MSVEVESGTGDGNIIKSLQDANKPVGVDIIIRLIRKAISNIPARHFILEGFPKLVHAGFPGVHDCIAALEADVGSGACPT